MPYVRNRGAQVAIVHGFRNPATKQVEQQLLFTFYSRDEIQAALGKANPEEARHFQHVMQQRFPGLRFDWPRIRRELEARLEDLPLQLSSEKERLSDEFRGDLAQLVRHVITAEPYMAPTAAFVVAAHRQQLEILKTWLDFRLASIAALPAETLDKGSYRWERVLRGNDVPTDIEEMASGHYERGENDRAEAMFRYLVELFPTYAEGWNYLGLIALRWRDNEAAIAHFERTVEVGRRNLPKRIGRDGWWLDLDTRPYMRGLRNLALAMIRAGRYRDAIAICVQLDRECHDEMVAASHLASAHLCLGEWADAREAALRIRQLAPDESLKAAFAAYESGDRAAAAVDFLHATMNAPRVSAAVLGKKVSRPTRYDEAEDHNAGIDMRLTIGGYLDRQSLPARRFFSDLWEQSADARQELQAVEQRREMARMSPDRAAYDRLMEMRSLAFAERLAKKLMG